MGHHLQSEPSRRSPLVYYPLFAKLSVSTKPDPPRTPCFAGLSECCSRPNEWRERDQRQALRSRGPAADKIIVRSSPRRCGLEFEHKMMAIASGFIAAKLTARRHEGAEPCRAECQANQDRQGHLARTTCIRFRGRPLLPRWHRKADGEPDGGFARPPRYYSRGSSC